MKKALNLLTKTYMDIHQIQKSGVSNLEGVAENIYQAAWIIENKIKQLENLLREGEDAQ